MSLLVEAKPEMAYLKLGIYGEAKSGKTFTSSKVAIGLHNFIKSKKPVAFADTETGSDFIIPMFQAAKIPLHTAKTRAFKDLLAIVDEAEKTFDILIIDSITHFWNELIESFMVANQITRIVLKHWQPLKRTWREFTERFINSNLHIIVAGRSADKWDEVEDEDGAKELRKVGTKMRTETEMGYEPCLLVEMEAIQSSPRRGGRLIHRAYVKGDRFNIIDGQIFDNPGFESFLPHIKLLNLGGEHKAIEPGRDSQVLFEKGDNSGFLRLQVRDILLEKIKNEILLLYPDTTAPAKKKKVELIKRVFKTHSWIEIEAKTNPELEAGLKMIEELRQEIEKAGRSAAPSKEAVNATPGV